MSATPPAELARIIAQRLLVEPNSHRPFFICEEPAPKLRRKPTVFLTVRLAALPLMRASSSPEIREASSE